MATFGRGEFTPALAVNWSIIAILYTHIMKRRYYPRESVPAVCVVCLTPFPSVHSGTIYCSDACCQKAYYLRRCRKKREAAAGDPPGRAGAEGAGDQLGQVEGE